MDVNRIKEFAARDQFANLIGAVVETVSDREVVCTLDINEKHLNAGGVVQGGVIFTLADFALALACNADDLSAGNGAISLSQSGSIIFFRPARGGRLTARTSLLQKGRQISVYRMTVTDHQGAAVAEMTANACRVTRSPGP
ncbi:MAG: PaaI family thioesterase [Candidatus Adiutrix sp.]|jgi:acyl-CoA thioesterase|nr:PaaI family thioesterase [Candidatus Adiutrix sp.]